MVHWVGPAGGDGAPIDDQARLWDAGSHQRGAGNFCHLAPYPGGRPKVPLSTSRHPPTGKGGPPTAYTIGQRVVSTKDPVARPTNGPWPMASVATTELQCMDLPTMEQASLEVNALIPDTAQASMIELGWSPQAIISRPSALRLRLICRSSHTSPAGRNKCNIDLVMRTGACSATPTTSGLRC